MSETSTSHMLEIAIVARCRFHDAGKTGNFHTNLIDSLVPHPSNNPNDPLNWNRWWKYATAISQLLYVWVLVCSALSLAPM